LFLLIGDVVLKSHLDFWDVLRRHDRRGAEPEELVDADDGVHQEQHRQQEVGQEGEDRPEAEVGSSLLIHHCKIAQTSLLKLF